jgi:WD40 repeat protein
MSETTKSSKAAMQPSTKAVGWETVNVFVSSTFDDMHAERDYLVKEVFPRLREWCEQRRLRLVDVDLRWGVTEADATRHKRVVDVCLRKIDDCRPFFICLLGQRYGWIPNRGDVADQTLRDFPGLDKVIETASVTELEVLHSCIEPMSSHERAEHAFFYLRQPTYVDKLPDKPAQLARTYTDQVEKDPASRVFLVAKQDELRKVKIPATGRPVHFYEASWDPAQKTPEIAMPLQCPAMMEENQEDWRRRWSWEAHVNVNGLDVAEDAGELAKAEAHNADLTKGRLGDFRCDGRSLGEVICEDLQAAITARFPDHVEVTGQTDLEREIALHEEFVYAATEGFIERTDDFDALDAWANDTADQRLMAVVAPGGVGKSTLLAKWVQRRRNKGEAVVCRFVGVGDRSASVDTLLHFLIDELRASGRLTAEVPDDPRKLRGKLAELLADCGKKGKTVVVIDALDQLESGLSDLDWLPLALPEGVKLVVSFKRGEPGADKLEENWRAGERVRVHEHRGFEVLEDRKKLVRAYLNQFLKELDEDHLSALTSACGADNPLFLRVVLSELRVFGAFGDLGRKIRDDFGDTPVSAFNAVLQRLESDPPPAGLDPRQVVPFLFGLLAHSRAGLPKQALLDILVEELGRSAVQRPTIEATLETYLRQVRPFLARREGRVDFFYASFRLAAQERYARADAVLPVRTSAAWHKCIARWCERWPGVEDAGKSYALGALVHHLVAAGEAERAAEVMTDFSYHYERLRALGRGDIVNVTTDFALTAGGLALAPAVRERLDIWKAFHAENAHLLRREVAAFACETHLLQLAVAHAAMSPVTRSAETWLDVVGSEVHWLRSLRRPQAVERSACLQVFEGHTSPVWAVAVLPDGRRAISASGDTSIKLWDLETGICLRTFEGHTGAVHTVALSSDGRRALSGSGPLEEGYDHALTLWDVETGRCLRVLEGHRYRTKTVAFLPDGHRAISGGSDKDLKLWDLDSGNCLQTLHGHTAWVEALVLLPDGRCTLSAGGDKTLKLWDLHAGHCLRTIEGHVGGVNALALLPDGCRALSASDDKTLKLWDLHTGHCLRTMEGHTGRVRAIALVSDGTRVLSGGDDKTLRFWDLNSGQCLRIIEGHTDEVNAVAVLCDGHRALSGTGSRQPWARGSRAVALGDTLKLWDLEADGCPLAAQGHRFQADAVALSSDGRHALSSGKSDSILRLWDVETGQCLRTFQGLTPDGGPVAFLPDGCRAISTLNLFDITTGQCLRRFEGETSVVSTVALLPDGRRVLSGSWDHTLKLWDLESGQWLRTFQGHSAIVNAVAALAEGRQAISASADHTLKLWNLETGRCLRTLEGHGNSVTSVAALPDGRRAISASADHTLRLWDLETGQCLGIFDGHREGVHSVAILADGCALSGSDDKTFKLWDLQTGQCLATCYPGSSVSCFAVGPEIIAAGIDGGEVLFLKLMPPGPLTRTTLTTWSPTHPLLATALDSGAVTLHRWHAAAVQLEPVARSAAIGPSLSSLRFSLDGTRLQVVIADDDAEHILDATTLQPAPPPACAWASARDTSPDGAWRVLIRDGRLVVDAIVSIETGRDAAVRDGGT